MKIFFLEFIDENNKLQCRISFMNWKDCITYIKETKPFIKNKTNIKITELTEIKNNNKNLEKYIRKTSEIKFKIENFKKINKLPF